MISVLRCFLETGLDNVFKCAFCQLSVFFCFVSQIEEEKLKKRQAKKEEQTKKRKKEKEAARKETEPNAKKARLVKSKH